MSWPQWSSAPQPSVPPVLNPATPVINSAPAVVPPGVHYTADQWAQLQQQNWHQWAQWQQQYQQWHQQYGAEYQKSINALAQATQQPVTGLPNVAVPPPLPAEIKPPLPADDPPPPTPSYTTAPPPVQPGGYNTQLPKQNERSYSKANQNWQGQNQRYDMKRPYDQQGDHDAKRQMLNKSWNNQPSQAAPRPPPKQENIEELSEAEKKFDKQFAEWEAQFNKWKEQNAEHPDKEQYREYEKKWESWRAQLLERREQMKRKRLGLTTNSPNRGAAPGHGGFNQQQQSFNSPQQSYGYNQQPPQRGPNAAKPPPKAGGLLPTPQSAPIFNKPPPNLNDEPLKFKPKPAAAILEAEESVGDFFKPNTTGGIPGLDLVKDDPKSGKETEDVVVIDGDNGDNERKGPDFDAISKGINTILGDQKLLNMLSMVSQNQNVKSTDNLTNTVSKIKETSNQDSQVPYHEQSNQSYEDYSNQSEGYGQREFVNNFDDQTRSSFTMAHNEQETRYDAPGNFGRNQKFDQNQFPNRFGNFNKSRFGGPENEPFNKNNFGRNDFNDRPFPPRQDGDRFPSKEGPDRRYPPPNQDRFPPNNDRPFAPPRDFNQPPDQERFGPNKDRFGSNQDWYGSEQDRFGPNHDRFRPNQNRFSGSNQDRFGPEQDRFGPNQDRFGPNQERFGLGQDRFPPKTDRFGPRNDFPPRNEPGFKERNFAASGGPNMPPRNDVPKRPFGFNDDNFTKNQYDDYGRGNEDYDESYAYDQPEHSYEADNPDLPPEDANLEELWEDKENYQSLPEERTASPPKPDILQPATVIDYDHKSLKSAEPEILLEPIYMFDYRHKALSRIPLPQRPKWLTETVKNIREFDPPVVTRPYEPQNLRRYPSIDEPPNLRRYPPPVDNWRMERYPEDHWPPSHNRRNYNENRPPFDDRRPPYGENRSYDESKNFNKDWSPSIDKRRDEKKPENNKPLFPTSDFGEEKISDTEWPEDEEEYEKPASRAEFSKFSKNDKPNVSKNTTLIGDLINTPGRFNRPPRIVIILRGPPGSGKTFLAKLIKDKEVENGGSTPRILSLDDYFMVEQEKEVTEEGKKVKIKEMVYEYEAEMEESYRTSLIKSFKKTITDGYFSFIIVDNVNDKVKYFGEMWSFAKQNGFQVYICQLDLDVQTCSKRNIHGRSEADIEKCVANWEPTPSHHPVLDATSLLQAASIPEVEMEEVNSPESDANEHDPSEDQVARSKWDNFDCSVDNLAKLDGVSKPLRHSRTMEEYLQLDSGWTPTEPTRPGQKRVRWADLEEQKQQEKMRAIGFVVGHTNWDRMMDPTKGSSALTQTKYIERTGRYKVDQK